MNSTSTLSNIEHTTYINTSPEIVYRTLTTGEGWDAWFTQGTKVDAKPGGFIRLCWKNFGPGRVTVEDGGPILEAELNQKFVFQWSPGDSTTTVAITLHKHGSGTFLKLVESGYSSSNNDVTAIMSCAIGWGEALTLLKFYLEHGVTYGQIPFDEEDISK